MDDWVPWAVAGETLCFQTPSCRILQTLVVGRNDAQFTYCEQQGPLLGTSLTHYLKDLRDRAPDRISLPALWDLRGHSFEAHDAEAFREATVAFEEVPDRNTVRTGFWVDSAVAFGMLRMFTGQADARGLRPEQLTRISYDLDELVDWVTGVTPLD